jgi:hypothetical protein
LRKVVPAAFKHYLDTQHKGQLNLGGEGQELSWRGLWVGSFLSFFLAVAAPYGNMIIRGTYMSTDFSTPGAIFLFLVLIGLLNVAFKLAGRGMAYALFFTGVAAALWGWVYWPLDALDWYSPGLHFSTFVLVSSWVNLLVVARGGSMALNRADLILVYVMLLIVAAVCTMGLGEQILPMISAVFYYASPQNKWAEKLFPHMPGRAMVDDGDNNRLFYEGLETVDQAIPYGAWVEPLLWWGVFLLALYLTMISVAVVLRRQWMERERLPYPMAQVGLSMIRGEGNGLVNDFFKRPSMWIGLSIPLFIGSLKALHRYYPSIPFINLVWHIPFYGRQRLEFSIRFVVMGFAYFINSNIAAGIWVFHLISKIEKEALYTMGIKSDQKTLFGVADAPLLGYQGAGALIAMVLYGLWVGRSHLKNVWLKAIGRAPYIDDSDEVMSYRAATAGVLGGMGVMALWLWLMGTPLGIAALFVGTAVLVFIGITRIVVEAGIPVVRSPLATPDLILQGLGPGLVGAGGAFNMSLAYIWAADTRVFVLATFSNGLKMIEEMAPQLRRRVFWGVILALFIGTGGALWMIFHMAYRHGGINLNSWFFKSGPAAAYGLATRGMELEGVYWPGMGFFAGGGVLMGLMMWARQRFAWWPVHPIGFPVGGNAQFMNPIVSSIFLAWAIKKIVLRYGGAALYGRSQAFFLGLISGQVLCNGIWLVIDYFTGKVGNHIFGI